MSPLLVALLAIVVVVGSILWLRLHAFLALLLGGLVVALLSQPTAIFEQELQSAAMRVVAEKTDDAAFVVRAGGKDKPAEKLDAGYYHVYRMAKAKAKGQDGPRYESVGRFLVVDGDAKHKTVELGFEVKTGDLVVAADDIAAANAELKSPAIERLAWGFGDTCRKIGLLIAMASIIGCCLLESGAAAKIVSSARSVCGDRHTPLAFTTSGFFIGIPVYFDTVFYLMIPLAKALRLKTGKNYVLYVMSIIVGATMAHSLIPPTPGPLLVAGELGIDLLTMIAGGAVIGLIAVAAGYAYSLWANRMWDVPLRDTPDADAESNVAPDTHPDKHINSADSPSSEASPHLLLAVAPIVVPVLLLTLSTTAKLVPAVTESAADSAGSLEQTIRTTIAFLGNKNIALLIGTLLGLVMLYRALAGSPQKLKTSLGQALSSAGMILLITAAGGAFGHVLRQSGVAAAVEQQFPQSTSGVGILVLAFALTVIIRFAQGSATVAMITTVGIVAPLAASGLPFHPVYLALAIGCGSKPFPWMNDSGFWVVSRMTGMTEGETLKTFSAVLSIMGFVGFAAVVAGAMLFPLTS